MVDARLHVRITFLSPRSRISSTLRSSFGSINGPFFSERDIIASDSHYRRLPRRRTIYCSVRLLRRVFSPIAGLPQGVLGPGIPMGERPSPPPCGWLLGSIAVPRTVGRHPSQRLRPALPSLMLPWSVLPTLPRVA